MKKKGKYLYVLFSTPTGNELVRISTVKKSWKRISKKTYAGPAAVDHYAIKGNRIYYIAYNDDNRRYVCQLNGKGTKRTAVKPILKEKKTNKKGYRVIFNYKTK